MNTFKMRLTRTLIVAKRLVCRPSFWVIVCLVPLLTLCMSAMAQKESGVVSIALCAEDQSDPVAAEIIDKLTSTSSLIKYTVCPSPEAAERELEFGHADAAWILPEKTEERIKAFVLDPRKDSPVVRIICREETVALRLANESLCGALYSYCAEERYLCYIRESLPELDKTDDALSAYYDEVWAEGDIFEYSYTESGDEAQASPSLLTVPLRGLLALLCCVAGLAASMFYKRDRERGLAGRFSRSERRHFEYISHLLPIAGAVAAVFVSLVISGQGVSLPRELALALLFLPACTSMCIFFGRIFGSIERLAVACPLLVMVMLVICPVFVDFTAMRPIQLLFAPTYFMLGAYSKSYLIGAVIYTAAMSLLNIVIGKIKKA